jgi:hypothetical protein
MIYSKQMDLNPRLAAQAIKVGLEKYPAMSEYGPRLVCRPVFGGVTYLVEYDTQPPRDQPDAWEFQNAAVREYKKLAEEQ